MESPTMYKAYGFPSNSDLLISYPLSLLGTINPARPFENNFVGKNNIPVIEDSILAMGKTLLGETRTYSQAETLCKAWRRQDKTRRSLIVIPKPAKP